MVLEAILSIKFFVLTTYPLMSSGLEKLEFISTILLKISFNRLNFQKLFKTIRLFFI